MGTRRLGLIVPSSNTVAEQDFQTIAGDDLTVHTARMFLESTTAEAEREMLAAPALQAATDLGTARCDVIVFSCTSAGALIGIAGEQALIDELARRGRAPVVSTNAAVADRLREIGARRIAVVTAYVDELNRDIEATLTVRGFEVTEIHGMGITDNVAIASVGVDEIVEYTRATVTRRDVDALFVSCTNLQAMAASPRLEAEMGVPVITSNSAARDVALAVLTGRAVGGEPVRVPTGEAG